MVSNDQGTLGVESTSIIGDEAVLLDQERLFNNANH
jgi:hypothetical protein